ncbi:MAG: hypothetical protein ACRDDX_05505 [Cellulosilyticaceae bacterium]
MSTQLERMKQLIEEKKTKNAKAQNGKRPEKSSVTSRKGFNNKKTGGLSDR